MTVEEFRTTMALVGELVIMIGLLLQIKTNYWQDKANDSAIEMHRLHAQWMKAQEAINKAHGETIELLRKHVCDLEEKLEEQTW